MSHYAHIKNNIVDNVIVAEKDFIDKLPNSNEWIKTSYNTTGGKHKLKKTPLRKNFACIGYTYDNVRDAFIPPKPYNSWILDENTCLWYSPKSKPNGNYYWNEELLEWIEFD